MLIVTSIFASILAIIFMRLSFHVIGLRRKNKVAVGTGGVDELDRAIRAHGNFSEYVPIGLILLGALELNGAPIALVVALGVLLTLGRLIHAKGINEPPPQFKNRVLGMKLTFAALAVSVMTNLAWIVYLICF